MQSADFIGYNRETGQLVSEDERIVTIVDLLNNLGPLVEDGIWNLDTILKIAHEQGAPHLFSADNKEMPGSILTAILTNDVEPGLSEAQEIDLKISPETMNRVALELLYCLLDDSCPTDPTLQVILESLEEEKRGYLFQRARIADTTMLVQATRLYCQNIENPEDITTANRRVLLASLIASVAETDPQIKVFRLAQAANILLESEIHEGQVIDTTVFNLAMDIGTAMIQAIEWAELEIATPFPQIGSLSNSQEVANALYLASICFDRWKPEYIEVPATLIERQSRLLFKYLQSLSVEPDSRRLQQLITPS